jgi:acetyl esterase/lipase
MPYGREELAAVAADLAARGFAVWNLEYRRLGEPGSGFPGTFDDVAAGIDHLANLVDHGIELDLRRVILAGHSAGGNLALWSAARGARPGGLRRPARVTPIAAAGLAAIVDLAGSFAANAGNGAAGELLGGSPQSFPERFAVASPRELLPLGVEQLIVHGAADEALPVASAREYAHAAEEAGDRVEYAELPRAGHMDFVDPGSEAHDTLCRWLERFR